MSMFAFNGPTSAVSQFFVFKLTLERRIRGHDGISAHNSRKGKRGNGNGPNLNFLKFEFWQHVRHRPPDR